MKCEFWDDLKQDTIDTKTVPAEALSADKNFMKSKKKITDATERLPGSASPLRKGHLIKGMRYWLNRAEEKLNRGYVSHAKVAVGKASEALDQLELETLLTKEQEALAAGLTLVDAKWSGKSDFGKGMRLLQKKLGIKR